MSRLARGYKLSFAALILLVLGLGVSGASVAAPGERGLDVNDVSFLLPIKGRRPHPAINLKSDLQIPQQIFEQVLGFESPGVPLNRLPYLDAKFLSSPQNWFVTSIRFDPCGEVFELKDGRDPISDDSIAIASRKFGCQARFRIVVQPFNLFGNPVATALHLIYKVDSSEIKPIAESLLEIKQMASESLSLNTTGLPLMLHPALAAETKGSEKTAVGDALRSSLLRALSLGGREKNERLEIVTMTVQVIIDQWRFVGGYVKNGSWQRFVTEFSQQLKDTSDPTLGLGVEELTCNGNSICLHRPTYQAGQIPASGLVLTQIFRDIPEMKRLQVPGHRSQQLHIDSEIIDHPQRTHFFNTNCVSCHASSNLRDPSQIHTDLGLPRGITPFVPKRFLTGLTNNIINFGYWGSVPRISTRTASESAAVANSLNQELGLKNPSPEITDLEEFWTCMVTKVDFKECLVE